MDFVDKVLCFLVVVFVVVGLVVIFHSITTPRTVEVTTTNTIHSSPIDVIGQVNGKNVYKTIIDGKECILLDGSNGHTTSVVAMDCRW